MPRSISNPRHGKAVPLVLAGILLLMGGVVIGMSLGGNGGSSTTATGGGEGDPTGTSTDGQSTEQGGTPTAQTPSGTGEPSRERPQPSPNDVIPPPVTLNTPRFEMGMLLPGEKKSQSIDITNNSDKPMTIEFTKPSCTCTSIDLANTVIQPGGSVALEAGYDARQLLGPKRSTVTIKLKDYAPISVDVIAEVSVAVRAIPAHISAFDRLSGEMAVESVDGEPFQILSFGDEGMSVLDWSPGDPPKSSYRVAWDLSAYNDETCLDAEGRQMPGWVWIETDHPGGQLLDVIVRHDCTRATDLEEGRFWHLNERRMLLGVLSGGRSETIDVAMEWVQKRPVDDVMDSVSCDSPAIASVELGPITSGPSRVDTTVTVTTNPEFRGPFYAELVVHARGGEAKMILVGKVVD